MAKPESVEDLLAALRKAAPRCILVTGPQRSGTTIGGQVIAGELGYKYVDETHLDPTGHLDPRKAIELFRSDPPEGSAGWCLQSAGLFYWVHNLGLFVELDIAVVVMVRKLPEIYSSQERWSWVGSNDFLRAMQRYLDMPEFEKVLHGELNNPAKMGYMAWFDYQQDILGESAFEFWYDWLKDHESWVPMEHRQVWKGWGFKTTVPLFPIGEAKGAIQAPKGAEGIMWRKTSASGQRGH